MNREPHSARQDPHDRECIVCRAPEAATPAQTIAHIANRAAADHPGADLALVLGDPELPAGWLDRLGVVAARESTTATVGALPGAMLAGEATEEALSLRASVLPEGIATARVGLVGGACVYVSRAAFDLLGDMDEALPSSPCVVADFGLRATERGLANLLAGDLLVPLPDDARLSEGDGTQLSERFPALWQAALEPPSAAVERCLAIARTAFRKLSVTIDARSLGASTGGTQVYTFELIRFLAATGEVRIRALVGPDSEATEKLEALDETSVITYQQALEGTDTTDLVHRPQQVFTVDDLELLGPLGRRLVITHLDLIAYHNPTYFPDLAQWQRHVRATRIALGAADHVIFFSAHALRDAEREDLLDPARTSVVALGAEEGPAGEVQMTRPQALVDRDEPFLLCLGSDYTHKNRPFALELTAELRGGHGWPGIIVLAGPHVEYGSSVAAERRVLELRPELAGAVVDLGAISEAERLWLTANARALVYPTVLEGFGLVPFEAAAAGIPCMFAAQSSLAELLPAELATLDGWNLERSGALAARLLENETERRRHVEALQRACRDYRWELCAQRTIDAYRRTLFSHARSSARQAWEALEREREIVRLDQGVHDLQERIQSLTDSLGADALGLVGPDGLLSREDQRALLAIVVRPALRRPLIASARAGYRLAHRRRVQE